MNTDDIIEQLDQHRRKVDFDTYDIIVQQLLHMVDSKAIDVAPTYQRQFRWENKKRSSLIESILLGVPVPSLFMATNKDGTWEVVDGVQRLSSIVQYAGDESTRKKLGIQSPLKLNGLDKLTKFNNTSYNDLPSSLQLKFLHRPIKVITLSDKSDLVVRFDLFERLNTGGVALSNQEIRACVFRGPFNDFLFRLAKNSDFQDVVKLTKNQEMDGTREECVLRFFAFYYRYTEFEHSVIDFLNEFMKDATSQFDLYNNEELFNNTFYWLNQVLPNGIVRTQSKKKTPLNLFEAVSVGAALAFQEQGYLNDADVEYWLGSDELRKLTTGATNNRSMVIQRIEYCRDKFLRQ